jgi:hypothetical protein
MNKIQILSIIAFIGSTNAAVSEVKNTSAWPAYNVQLTVATNLATAAAFTTTANPGGYKCIRANSVYVFP